MKRFLAFVLTVCLVFSLFPVSTLVVSAEPEQQNPAVHTDHYACTCAMGTTGCDHGTDPALVWSAWDSDNALPTAAGNYYLTKDVTLSAIAAIAADINLCLNGHNINLNGKKITNTGNLTIMNCQATLNEKNQLTSENGKIYGGKNDATKTAHSVADYIYRYGGAIGTTGNLNLIGVLFANNVNDYKLDVWGGGALYAYDGIVTINSCKFYQNEAKCTAAALHGSGGAISIAYNASMNVQDSIFDSNKAQLYGGAIMVYNRDSHLSKEATKDTFVNIGGNSEFTNNSTVNADHGYGSAMYLWARATGGKRLTVTIGGNTLVTGNSAKKEGGVLLRSNSATYPLIATIKDSVKITGNSAYTSNYADVYVNDNNTKLTLGKLAADADVMIGTVGNKAADAFLIAGAELPTGTSGVFYKNTKQYVAYDGTALSFVAPEAHSHHACLCAIDGVACGETHASAELTWTPWTNAAMLPQTAGNYYLMSDVKLAGRITITSGVNLCLNGHDVNLNGFKISNSGNLTIMNCQAKLNEKNQLISENGKIFGGRNFTGTGATQNNKYGGAIGNSGNLTLLAIQFANNLNDIAHDCWGGGAVFTSDNLTTIKSCKFYQNEATSTTAGDYGPAGAFSVVYNASATIMDTVFDGNKAKLFGGAIMAYNRDTSAGKDATKDTFLYIGGNSVFTNNQTPHTAHGIGSAIYVRQRAAAKQLTFTLADNTEITGNVAQVRGAVVLKSQTASMPLIAIVQDSVKIFGNTVNTASNAHRADVDFDDTNTKLSVGELTTDAKIVYGTKDNQSDPDQALKVATGTSLQPTDNTNITYANIGMQVGYSTAHGFTFNHIHSACACELTGNNTCADGHTDDLEWMPWSNANALPTTTGNYYLTGDVDMTGVVGTNADAMCLIAGNSNVKLCLNGFNIKLNSDNAKKNSYRVPGTSSLTIINCQAQLDADNRLDLTTSKGGKIYGGKAEVGGAILSYGQMNVIGILFEDNTSKATVDDGRGGGAILVHKGNTRVLHSYFKNNTTSHYGGAISVFPADSGATAKTTLLVADTVFEGNKAATGGAVNIVTNGSTRHGATLTIRDSLFLNNEATTKGGAIQIWRSGASQAAIAPEVTVTGTEFRGNTSKNGGGVVRVLGTKAKLTPVTFTDCIFNENNSASNGGVLNAEYVNMTLNNCTVEGNTAPNYGAVLYSNLSEITLNDCTMRNNESKGHGGVAYIMRSKLYVTGGEFRGNKAGDSAGVFYISGDANMSLATITGGTYAENTAKSEGGIARIVKGHLTVTDATIENNEAKNGGAISLYVDPDVVHCPTLNISGDTEFSGNKATTGGALFLYRAANAKDGVYPITNISGNTLFLENDASSYGGAIFLQRKTASGDVPELNLSENVKITNNTSANGGALWFGSTEDRATVSGNVAIYGNTAKVGNDVYFFNKAQHLIVGELGTGVKINVTTKENMYTADPDEFLKVAENVTLADMDLTGIVYANTDPAKGIGYKNGDDKFYFTVNVTKPHQDHTACGCAITGATCTDAVLTWKPWPYADRLPATTGNWYLVEDVYVGNLTGGSTGLIEILKGEKVNLCLNGFSIKFNDDHKKSTNYYVASGGNLTLMNCQATYDKDRNLIESAGGKLYGGKTTNGGAIRAYLSEAKFIGIHFTGNTATSIYNGQGGGALYLDRGQYTVQSCLFTNNTTDSYGSAICHYAGGEVNVIDSVFKNNYGKMAGCISMYTTGSTPGKPVLNVTGNTKFIENEGGGAGSCIYMWRYNSSPAENAPVANFNGTYFANNIAKGKGTIRVRGSANRLTTANIENCVFENNETEAGGAISSENATLNIKGSTFNKNVARTTGGGAIYAITNSAANIENSVFTENNTIGAGGGAILVSDKCDLKVTGSNFTKNYTAKNDSGAIRVWRTSNAEIKDSKFIENTSPAGGAIGIFRGSKMVISGGEFTKNKATGSGGVLYVSTTSTKTTTYDAVELTLKDNVQMYNNEATNGACMYLVDSVLNVESATMRNNVCIKKGNGGAFNAKNTKVTLGDGAVLQGNYAENGGAIVLQAKSVMDMNGGSIKYNSAERGGGICMWTESTLNMRGGSINGNEGRTNAGAIYVNNKSVVNLTGGTFYGNFCKYNGGAIQLYKNAKIYLYGGYFSNNEATAGGALHAKDASDIYLYYALMENNTANVGGGAIKIDLGGKLVMKGGELINNVAIGNGGGVSADGDMEMTGGKISYNKVIGSDAYQKPRGGGIASNTQNSIYSQGFPTLNISGGEISHNETVMGGGGLWIGGRTTLNLTGGVITENNGGKMGGGIMVDNIYTVRSSLSILRMTGGDIFNNTAIDGGGIYARYAGKVYLTDVNIHDNVATGTGGGVYLARGVVSELTNLTLTGNKALFGAGLYFMDDTLINGLDVHGNDAGDGYAVYLDRGEYDGQSYVLGLIKLCGNIRIFDNSGAKPGMFIGMDNVLVEDPRGFGQDTKINIDLEKGVLTNTILGTYDYEGGNLEYVLTYGDRSLTELEDYQVETEEENVPATEATDPTETGAEEQKSAGIGIGGIAGISGGLIVAVIAVLAGVSISKKKKAGKTAEGSAKE